MPIVLKYGSLSLLELSGTVQAFKRVAFLETHKVGERLHSVLLGREVVTVDPQFHCGTALVPSPTKLSTARLYETSNDELYQPSRLFRAEITLYTYLLHGAESFLRS